MGTRSAEVDGDEVAVVVGGCDVTLAVATVVVLVDPGTIYCKKNIYIYKYKYFLKSGRCKMKSVKLPSKLLKTGLEWTGKKAVVFKMSDS